MKCPVGAHWLLGGSFSLTLWAGGPAVFSVVGGRGSQLHTLWPAANGKSPSLLCLSLWRSCQLELLFPEANNEASDNWAS